MLCIPYILITPPEMISELVVTMCDTGYNLHIHNYSSLRFSLLAQSVLLPLFRKAHAIGRSRLNPCHVAEPPLSLPNCSQLKPKAGSSRSGWKQECGHNDSNLFAHASTHALVDRKRKTKEKLSRSVLQNVNIV